MLSHEITDYADGGGHRLIIGLANASLTGPRACPRAKRGRAGSAHHCASKFGRIIGLIDIALIMDRTARPDPAIDPGNT